MLIRPALSSDLDALALLLQAVVEGAAEQLYLSPGYQSCGVIPGHALDVHRQSPEATHILYKQLAWPLSARKCASPALIPFNPSNTTFAKLMNR